MERKLIKHILASSTPQDSILIQGWVRTRRDSKAFSFIEVNDGTSLKNLQVVVDASLPDYRHIGKATTGSSVAVTGSLVASQGKGQSWEVIAETLAVIGEAGEGYPLQKKGHTLEFLRENAHLRPRTNLFGSVFRVRSRVAYAIHQFFQERDFVYVHTPLITGSDCEGAGEMFQVSTLDLQAVPIEDGKVDFSDDFFGRPTYLTVSGQLEGEAFATALSNIYTFGPTFRAENSNTSRHANEFWMIEPEVAFCNLEGDMDLAETFVKYLVADTLGNCREELEFFNRFVDKGLIERLESIRDRPFVRISYTDAVKLLQDSDHKFEYPVTYGANLQSEHERYLTEVHFQCPVTVHDYPREIKPFYMRLNDDEKTVAAMDVLVPGIGEIVGGSQREERLKILDANFESHNISKEDYWWYRDLRRFGSVPHSGFGLGFERMLMLVTGVANIRDVIPFARTPGNAEF
jgi:asparaginyl-tRNA synthetase